MLSIPYSYLLLVNTNEVLTEIAITCEDVRYELKNLNCFKSVGLDSIHFKLLKSLVDDFTFVELLTNNFFKIYLRPIPSAKFPFFN